MKPKESVRLLALLLLLVLGAAGAFTVAGASISSPLGTEFRINQFIESSVATGGLAMDADGNAVAVWFDAYDPWTIQARLIDESGQPQGNQFTVATYGTGDLRDSEVAMDAAGNFTVVWEGVYLRRFDANGSPFGEAQKVSSTDDTERPQISMAPNGDFVVVWGKGAAGTLVSDVMARLYGADGAPKTQEINVATGGEDYWGVDVAMNASGDFVVLYAVEFSNGSESAMFQRYDADGVAQGSAFDLGPMLNPQVAIADDGHIAIVYASPDADELGVWLRSFDADGVELGEATIVNTMTAGSQNSPQAAMNGDGLLYIVWTANYVEQNGQYEAGRGVHARHFNAVGQPLGDEFKVNSYPSGAPYEPLAAIDGDGDTLTIWSSWMQDGYNSGIYGQYNEPVDPQIPLLFSFSRKGRVDGLKYQASDILKYDPATGDWSMFFDASDYKVRRNLQGFALLPDSDILMTFQKPVKLPGLGKVPPQDIVRFDPGTGEWSLYLDGSDVELTKRSEALDAVAIDRDGSLLLSSSAALRVTGLSAQDEDIVRFTPTSLGDDTSGVWSQVLNGIWYGNHKDLWSLWSDTESQDDYFFMTFERTVMLDYGNVRVPNGSVVRCLPHYPEADGWYHGCTFDVYWNGSEAGLSRNAKIDGFALLP